ncbi:hypothetical protein [Streptomyces sp. MP131-18]|uniref:hypothetical protein n=1 Tax=Streptomyces sp. MP131-18 TaxID=1857892 RepID=UPI00097BAF99|nr:hypothetical protein [Streptomyces sp. MP131-18]ONK12745.1 hypothetical protein STBA_34970 [Streptomyces sp. MP131-18]
MSRELSGLVLRYAARTVVWYQAGAEPAHLLVTGLFELAVLLLRRRARGAPPGPGGAPPASAADRDAGTAR